MSYILNALRDYRMSKKGADENAITGICFNDTGEVFVIRTLSEAKKFSTLNDTLIYIEGELDLHISDIPSVDKLNEIAIEGIIKDISQLVQKTAIDYDARHWINYELPTIHLEAIGGKLKGLGYKTLAKEASITGITSIEISW